MLLRWTTAAADDLESIAQYLFEKSPQNAAQLIRKIYETPSALQNYPNLGRPGKKEGTRELVITPYHTSSSIKLRTTPSISLEFCMALKTGRSEILERIF